MRPVLPLLAAAIALMPPLATLGAVRAPALVRFTPVRLGQDRFGELAFVAGWHLSSRDRRFGGLSALVPLGPGRYLALSDAAMPVAIDVGDGRRSARLLPTLDVGAAPAAGKSSYDSESAARDPATGALWVGLERRNAILRYDARLRMAGRTVPAAMKRWPGNGGAEAMALLPGGRLLVISESEPGTPPGTRQALLFPSDPTRRRVPPLVFGYRPPPGYDPSDAAALPDGRVMVLNRRLALPWGFAAALTVVDPRGARAGTVLTGRLVAELPGTVRADNLEGLAVGIEDGRTIVTLASDDNFLPFERTLLLRFHWTGAGRTGP